MTTIATAKAALIVPVAVQNNNAVQDAQARLQEALTLAATSYADADPAPWYVVRAVEGLNSWVAHALKGR